MTIEEFLAQPDEKPYREFLRGEVQEKPMPTQLHGRIVWVLSGRLYAYFQRARGGYGAPEVRHRDDEQDWVFLPDLAVYLGSGQPLAKGAVNEAPPFAIEVLSPDDQPARWIERVTLYLNAGTLLLWVIDPEARLIRVYRAGHPPQVARDGSWLAAVPVLPGFSIDVTELFDEAGA
jgi:Uma2 family endonuclease